MTPPGRASSWDSAPVALLRLDGAGAILDVNDTFRGWFDDDTAVDLRGTRLSTLLSAGGRIYWETHLAPLLRMQGRVEEIAIELHTGGIRRPVLLSAELHGADDDVLIDVALFDARERSRFERELVTARAEAERSAASVRTLLVTTTALAQAAGVEGVCKALVHAAVGEFRAESAAVWLVGGSGTLTLRAELGIGASIEEASAALLAVAGPTDTDVEETSAAGRSGIAPRPVAGIVIDPRGKVTVPLHGAETLHGVLILAPRAHAGDDALDRDALAATGQQGGVALDRAVLHEQSVSVAHELQRAMLTDQLPQPDGARISADYRPAERSLEVGGDWYDAFWVDETTLALTVGDVVGHGLQSATAMGQLRTVVRGYAESGVGASGVLTRVNRFVQQRSVGFGSTLVYTELDVITGRLTFACAGHLPPLVTRPDDGAQFLWQGRWMPLGVASSTVPVRPPSAIAADRSGLHATLSSGPERGQGTVDLRHGEVVWLYTDGMVERRGRSLREGLAELARAAAGPPGSAPDHQLISSLLGGDVNVDDDACVLRLEWHGQSP